MLPTRFSLAGPLGVALALLAVATAYLWKLDRPLLWGDEAGTAVYARTLLATGELSAFDGRNLTIYGGGTEVSRDLRILKIPWGQFYVAAASLRLFGDDTRGVRALFALLGCAALLPIRSLLRGRLPCPTLLAALLLVSPQVLLFHRNARYFSLLTLLYACLLWVQLRPGLGLGARTAGSGVCFVLLAHTHPLVAATSAAAVVARLLLERAWKAALAIGLSGAVGLGSWWLWYRATGPMMVEPEPMLALLRSDPGAWFGQVGAALLASLLELDAVGALPLGLWALVLAVGVCRRGRPLRVLGRDPFARLVLLTLVIHVVGVAALLRPSTDLVLRYMPHLIALLPAVLLLSVRELVARPVPFLATCAALFSTNLLTWSYHRPGERDVPVPVSWWAPTYGELLHPEDELWDDVRALIEERSDAGTRDEGIVAVPTWMQEIVIYYFGDRFLSLPDLGRDPLVERRVLAAIGPEALARLRIEPRWVVLFHAQGGFDMPGYERFEFPVHRLRPDDGTRPELTRHTFRSEQPIGTAYVFRRS